MPQRTLTEHRCSQMTDPGAGGSGRLVIRGTPISGGLALGKAFVYKDVFSADIASYTIEETAVGAELSRIRAAFAKVNRSIERTEQQVRHSLGRTYANIFMVHRTILNDVALFREIESRLQEERLNAEQIVRAVFKCLENRLRTSGSVLIRERCLDIADLCRRLLWCLTGAGRRVFPGMPRNSIMVARRLLPSESVRLRQCCVRAIVTETGSKTAHAAILARGMGMPYISETTAPIDGIADGDELIVDANAGEVVVRPERAEWNAVRRRIREQEQARQEMILQVRDLDLTYGGRAVQVLANANTKSSVGAAAAAGADGIGLFRIEQMYLQRAVFPSQDQLFRCLADACAPMRGREIVVRLLDIGGDKKLPYFDVKDEGASVMGIRGVRVLLRYPRLLRAQLTALLRLHLLFPLKILVPLVTLPEEIFAIRRHLARSEKSLQRAGIPYKGGLRVGAMIEVPAAVLRIEEILQQADFVSIGTNDLIQYTMAIGRENGALARYYEAGANVILPYIRQVVETARLHGAACSLCGELASDVNFTAQLLNLGLTAFSVSASSVPQIKHEVRRLAHEVVIPAQSGI